MMREPQSLNDSALPRERLLELGAEQLLTTELLAIVLGTGGVGMSVLAFSQHLLEQCGGIRGLLERSPRQLCQQPGIGIARATRLLASAELGRRCSQHNLIRKQTLCDPSDASQFLSLKLRHYRQEVFACLFLDNQHRVLAFEELSRGTVDSAHVHPREVLIRCLEHNASAVIFSHNHPSGIAEPSAADRHITVRLMQTLSLVDIRVLDHIIIGDGQWTSLAQKGWLAAD